MMRLCHEWRLSRLVAILSKPIIIRALVEHTPRLLETDIACVCRPPFVQAIQPVSHVQPWIGAGNTHGKIDSYKSVVPSCERHMARMKDLTERCSY
jgi:hypothetical protein